MSTYKLTVTSPDGDLFSGDIEGLFLRGAEGDLAVLAGHIPFVTTVKAGVCRIEFADGNIESYETNGGILSVTKKSTRYLTGSFRKTEIDN